MPPIEGAEGIESEVRCAKVDRCVFQAELIPADA